MKHRPPMLPPADREPVTQCFREGERVVLTTELRRPHFEGSDPAARRLERYYSALARQWQSRWETLLLPQAKKAVTAGGTPWTASLGYELTCWTPQVLSLWWEAEERTDASRPRRLRSGELHSCTDGTPIAPAAVFSPLGRRWRHEVAAEVQRQITQRVRSGESLFYERSERELARLLREERFFLTGQGPCCFFPVGSIAPPFEGFPTFCLSTLLPHVSEGATPTGEDT